MACATCGSAIVAEIKKGIYIYYCTSQHEGRNWPCRRKHVCEEVLERQFHDLLGLLTIDNEVLAMLNEALRSSSADQWKGHEEAIRRFQDEYKRLDNIIRTMYEDRLAELISKQTFEKKSREYREVQALCLAEIRNHQECQQSYMDNGSIILEVAACAQLKFKKQDALGKKRLLKLLRSNPKFDDGKVPMTFRKPFDFLIKRRPLSRRYAQKKRKTKTGSPGRTRTSDTVVNSHLLYQLSYRGSDVLYYTAGRIVSRVRLEARAGIEPTYTVLQTAT